jgi:hypothetical protein
MNTRRNAALGWTVWNVGKRVAKKKARDNQLKLGAVGIVAVALASGVIAARTSS